MDGLAGLALTTSLVGIQGFQFRLHTYIGSVYLSYALNYMITTKS